MTAAATPDASPINGTVRHYTVLEELTLTAMIVRELGQSLDADTLDAVVKAIAKRGDTTVYDRLGRFPARNAAHAMRTVARQGLIPGTEDEMQFVAISDKGWQQEAVRVNHTATVSIG